MRYLENLNDTSVIKHGDSSETLRLSARNDNEPVTWDSGDTATIHVNQVVKQIPAKLVVGSNNVLVDSGDLADLAAGKYGLELWVTLKSGKTAIWPSNGSLAMTIDKNSDEITGDTVTTITLEDLQKRVDDKIAAGLKNIKLDPSQIPSVDLSDYAKKSDVPSVIYDKTAHTLTVNGTQVSIPADVDLSGYAKLTDIPKIDLTPYITASAADSRYALKDSVPSVHYDAAARTLTVDGQQVSLPASVDLSDYARKDSVPDVVLDVAARTLSVNGVAITIPESVDLSKYALSSQVPSVTYSHDTNTITIDGTAVKIPDEVNLSNYYNRAEIDQKLDTIKGSSSSVDLTGYVKKSDLADYARKTDIPVVPDIKLDTAKRTLTVDGQELDIPDAVDLSQYAKVDDVPKVALDVEKRTITIDGTSIDVPAKVDLTGYVTEAEMTAAISKVASGGQIDLTGYVTKADADATYETQEDARKFIPRAIANNIFAKKGDLPKVTYDTTSHELKFTQNGTKPVIVTIPQGQDIDLSPYLKTATADATYAKKADIPAAVDLTPYLKSADAEKAYVKNADLAGYAKKTDLSNYVTSGDFNDSVAGIAEEIPQVKYDSEKHTLNVNGTNVTIPQSVDMSAYLKAADAEREFAKKADVPDVRYDYTDHDLTVGLHTIHLATRENLDSYVLKTEAQDYASKSEVPKIEYDGQNEQFTINGNVLNQVTYNKTGGYLNVGPTLVTIPDSNNFAPLVWVKNMFAKKEDVPDISYDADKKTLTVNGKTIDLSGSSSSSSIWFKSDAVNTSITWTYNGHTAYQTPISSLTGKGGDPATKVTAGDVVIDGTGKAFTVYGTIGSDVQLIEIGSTAGKGVQAKNITDWNAYQGGLSSMPMQYYGKKSIKDALQLEDGKTYTMDLDAGTLVNETDKVTQNLLPGIYQLRDLSTDVDNLTIKSDSNFGGNGGNAVQATVTPYKIDVVLVNGTDVVTAWRSVWLADGSEWFGVQDKWHVMK